MSILAPTADVLRLFVQGEQAVGVATLVQRLGWPKSTSSRVLTQMADHGLLERDPTDRQYRPGMLLIELAQAQRRGRQPLQRCAHDVLTALCARTGHTAHLSVLDGTDSVLLEHVAGSNPLQVMSPVGSRLPASVTAMGRALLSRLSDDEFRVRYGKANDAALPPARPRCPRNVGALLRLVRQARKERSAVAVDEGLPGVAAVATTLLDPDSGMTVGLALSFPAQQVTPKDIEGFRAELVAMTAEVGRRLGDPWWSTPSERKRA